MGKKVKQAIQATLNAIESCKRRIAMFNYIAKYLNSGEKMERAIDAINAELFRNLNESYSRLFMWGNLATDEAQKEARKVAFSHYLNELDTVMEKLDMDLKHPGMWDSEEEREFRREIEGLKTDEEKVKKV